MSKEIIVEIDSVGNPKIEAVGFNDMGCKAATKPIEDVFSGGNANTVEKPQMSVPESMGQTDQLEQGGYGM